MERKGRGIMRSGREPGVAAAIAACGGITELARRLGISQPSISNWRRVPAERLLAVEAATGIDRSVLRPDLFQRRPVAANAEAGA